jgi:DNA-directed RNA polymerase subunit RPC12/RpoP
VSGAKFCAKCGEPIQLVQEVQSGRTPSDFITLSCPNCGGKLEITPETDRFSCKFCGMEHLVKHTGNAISLAPVLDGLKRVEGKFDQVLSGSDRLAAEQTIQRLKSEIADLEKKVTEKEASINTIVPRVSMHRLANSLIQIASIILAFFFFIFLAVKLSLFVDFPKIENFLQPDTLLKKWVIWVPIGVVIMLLASILQRASLAKRTVRVNPVHPNAYEKQVQEVSNEIEALKADLEERKNQLEQLHRYTTER